MNIEFISLILGLAMVGGGVYQFRSSLLSFLKIELTKSTAYTRYFTLHFAWIVVVSSGLGLLGLSLISSADTNIFQAIFNPFVLGLSSLWLFTAIALKQKKGMADEFHPMLTSTIILLSISSFVFVYTTLEAVAPGVTYPLPKGIPFANPLVTFYAIFILIGALSAYILSEREFIKRGKKKGYVEDVFLIAFPAGILGSRLWYVWGQWNVEFAGEPLWRIFALWEGGLAIMGGALGGALVGILYVYFKRKDIVIIQAVDWAIPTILLAQAIGRWGNFFNQEVYGQIADVNNWMWLPTIIREQMTIQGSFRVPLFFIESLINLTGFFVLRYGIGYGLKKWTVKGDVALMYLVWYGLTRGIMEPLRNPSFNMGTTGDWSFIWGWVFFAVGLIAIIINHLLQRKLAQKHV
jgi:phosphatidylglycerol:prolipoprotein diacylglycerol transferase